MFFYGDEAGMWGANDPDCRKPMVWPEKKYSAETFNPDQTKHDPDVGVVQPGFIRMVQEIYWVAPTV
jgi:glycosidase